MFHYRRRDNGTPLSFQTQHKRLISVRMFFQWLTRQYHLLFNPASELELPRTEQRLSLIHISKNRITRSLYGDNVGVM